MLCLVDIDGTLLRGGSHIPALLEAASAQVGLEITRADWNLLDAKGGVAGCTDMQIMRHVLRSRGISDQVFDSAKQAIAENAISIYESLPPPAEALPGAVKELQSLAQDGVSFALLTGNLEPIAHKKVQSAGFDMFPLGQGAFGSDAEDRNILVPIALSRASLPTSACVVGDTPRDIACARAGGISAVAVTTGPYDAQELQDADVIIPDISSLRTGLTRLGWALP